MRMAANPIFDDVGLFDRMAGKLREDLVKAAMQLGRCARVFVDAGADCSDVSLGSNMLDWGLIAAGARDASWAGGVDPAPEIAGTTQRSVSVSAHVVAVFGKLMTQAVKSDAKVVGTTFQSVVCAFVPFSMTQCHDAEADDTSTMTVT